MIDAASAASPTHQPCLSPGLLALLKQAPAFRMHVYASHRTAAFRANAAAVPFVTPRNGLEAITNHLLRDQGGGVRRDVDTFVVRANGHAQQIGVHEDKVYEALLDEHQPDRLFVSRLHFLSPADLVGTIYLVHEPDPRTQAERRAWVYNAGQRRVRRAPDLAYDSAQNAADGLAIVDQYDGYNGRPDRYDWTLVGKRELYVPYNNYRIADKRIPYTRIALPGSPAPELMRFELHRVWQVEATLKAGQTHVYARRVFYLDEDSWAVLLSEAYDAKGQLWRAGVHGLMQVYTVPVPAYRFEWWFDFSNKSYVLTGLDNGYSAPWQFGQAGRTQDFQPDALRRAGH
ncbi:DUF1329 domain-containing protein [Aquabacterium sp.]|uniref:DUF1329 domain-containing protein n=1 Tax=Aquabacterium sp. TaxID=1872578 RepID=UPI0025C1C656|nr:DUF1329 domain-containing protein [Aquabacterium sp.]